MEYQKRLYAQLALDFSLSPEDFPLRKNHFVKKAFLPGRRLYRGDACLLQLLSVDSHLTVASTDADMLDWCRARFQETDGAWISEPDKLFPLETELRRRGHYIAAAHPFFIPGRLTEPEDGLPVRWYGPEDLEVFRGRPEFRNVLGNGLVPDMLVIAAMLDGRIVGAAGASADSPTAWQIGVDVLPDYRGRGIAVSLVRRLAMETVRRGKLPFYGTGSSHMRSQRVAVSAGFVPGWWELYTKKV